MNKNRRLLFDVTYTRGQSTVTGITRTVRRLLEEFKSMAQEDGWVCDPVAFHRHGFRLVKQADNATSPEPHLVTRRNDGSRLFGWITSRAGRQMVLIAVRLLPWLCLKPVWGITSTWVFGAQTKDFPQVQFGRGDILVIADAAWNYCSWKAARLAREQGAHVVVVIYDLMPLRRPDFCFALLPLQFRTWLLEMLRCSDTVICISKATENDLRDWIAEQLDESAVIPPIRHFRLGSDPVLTSTQGDARASIVNFLATEEPCFAAIGSFEPKRNYPQILRVFERLWQRGMAVRLILAGRPTAECAEFVNYLKHHSEQGKRLQVVHDASDAEVMHIYNACRALVMPSMFEGFGLPLVEARMRGCLVIASDIPAFVELADEGVFIFKRHSDEALEALLLQHIKCDYRARVSAMPEFTWRESASQLLLCSEKS